MSCQTASDGISRETLRRGSPNFTRFSGITDPTNLPDMRSPVASNRLQNAIQYWTKVMRKTGPAGQRIHQMLHGHPCRHNLQPHRILTSPGTCDRHLSEFGKRPKMPPPTNSSGAAFCLPDLLVGILFSYILVRNFV